MTDEIGEPNQAFSNNAESMYDVIREILDLHQEKKKISTAVLIKREYIDASPNTVRKNTKKLQSLNIIKLDISQTNPNNEKFYIVKDFQRAKRFEEMCRNISTQNYIKRGRRSRKKRF